VDGLLLSWRIEKAFIMFLHSATLARENAASNADLNQHLQNFQGPVPGPADIAQPSTPGQAADRGLKARHREGMATHAAGTPASLR